MFSLKSIRILTVIWFVVELWLSHSPGDRSSKESRFLSNLLHIDEELLRNLAHVFCFSILSALAILSFGYIGLKMTVVWCTIDELTKKMVPGRHCSVRDIFLNLCGTLLGAVVILLI